MANRDQKAYALKEAIEITKAFTQGPKSNLMPSEILVDAYSSICKLMVIVDEEQDEEE